MYSSGISMDPSVTSYKYQWFLTHTIFNYAGTTSHFIFTFNMEGLIQDYIPVQFRIPTAITCPLCTIF